MSVHAGNAAGSGNGTRHRNKKSPSCKAFSSHAKKKQFRFDDAAGVSFRTEGDANGYAASGGRCAG
jgi:hypothetical protein